MIIQYKKQIPLIQVETNATIYLLFDEQERHPALLREPDMMDTPPIQMIIKGQDAIYRKNWGRFKK